MVCAVVLITDVLFGEAMTIAFAVAAAIVFGTLWGALPLWRRPT